MRGLLGIDEAGRGCVLGDLVVGAFFIPSLDDEPLRRAGATDSKRLRPSRRTAIRETLARLGQARTVNIEPAAIDAGNLNVLEEEAILSLIRAFEPERVLIDALGHPRTLPRFVARLRDALGPRPPTIITEPKADARYPVVGAASIVAKTHRDALLDALRRQWGALGSGYPSDPTTRAWLEAHARTGAPWPPFVRTRWGTVRSLTPKVE